MDTQSLQTVCEQINYMIIPICETALHKFIFSPDITGINMVWECHDSPCITSYIKSFYITKVYLHFIPKLYKLHMLCLKEGSHFGSVCDKSPSVFFFYGYSK